MDKETTVGHDLSWPPFVPVSPAGAEPPEPGAPDLDGTPTGREPLRWRLLLALERCLAQEKYVAWLRSDPLVDAHYLAEEEAFLGSLRGQVKQALVALEKAPMSLCRARR